MTQPHRSLLELADRFGIAKDFWDWKGNPVQIPAETIEAVLAALDVDASTPERCEEALVELEIARWRRVLPQCIVVEEHRDVTFDVHVRAGTSVHVEVLFEQGGRVGARQVDNFVPDREIDGVYRGEATFVVAGQLPTGYHRLVAYTDDGEESTSLIVTPHFVGLPDTMQGGRAWGYGTQLYSLSSERSWGVGDLDDLSDLATWAGAKQYADYVLINPLHAAQAAPPLEPSPYLPTSRRFFNPIYIRPEAIPEYAWLRGKRRREIETLRQDSLARGVESGRVERDHVWPRKIDALRIVFHSGLRPARRFAFDEFRRREGEAVELFAVWSALSAEHGPRWHEWPEEYRNPRSLEVAEFARDHADDVDFYVWLQWIAQEQIGDAQQTSRGAGMAVGVVSDLAVGVHKASAETWMMPDVFAQGMHVGAPPDQYNQAGQDWGQPPWRPDRLRELCYEPFRAMVRAALRGVGGVRIDHIIGLFRLWWVPEGLGPTFGTYVRYDHEAMVGILALEAKRERSLIIGEDLGTVEPWVRHYLAGRGLLGTSVLWFEYGQDGNPLDADRWREYCVASVNTHDLPPTIGYLAGDHVRLRHDLGVLTEPLDHELMHAKREQSSWVGKLVAEGLLADDSTEDPVEIMLALHRYIARTPARVLLANLVDAVGERRIQNQPGTINEYPNWRVPLGDSDGEPLALEDIYDAELPKRLAAVMNGLESAEATGTRGY